MLKKLVKYDLRFIVNKVLVIYYIVALCMAVVTRLMFGINNSVFFNVVAQICSSITISAMFGILINNVIRCWVRFKQNFYADESYLTHTLPIGKSTHYAAKFFSAVGSLLISFAAIVLTLIVAYYSKENFEFVKQLLVPFAENFDSSVWKLMLLLVLVVFAELLTMIQAGYIGIVLGHRFNSGKTALSVLFGGVAYLISQSLVLLCTFLIALCDREGLMQIFTQNTLSEVSVLKTLIYIGLAIYTVLLAIGYVWNVHLFKKGVNVD